MSAVERRWQELGAEPGASYLWINARPMAGGDEGPTIQADTVSSAEQRTREYFINAVKDCGPMPDDTKQIGWAVRVLQIPPHHHARSHVD